MRWTPDLSGVLAGRAVGGGRLPFPTTGHECCLAANKTTNRWNCGTSRPERSYGGLWDFRVLTRLLFRLTVELLAQAWVRLQNSGKRTRESLSGRTPLFPIGR